MTDFLVNSYYSLDYFTLPNVDQIKYPETNWWSSRQRFASISPDDLTKYMPAEQGGVPADEYFEIDFGHLREVNYMSMNIMRCPVSITIEYDTVSDDDNDEPPLWKEVTPIDDMPFDHEIHYDSKSQNAWHHAQFYFLDAKENIIHTRFIRIKFHRRDVEWPTRNSKPFRWAVSVKNLRAGRFIKDTEDTVGVIFDSGPGHDLLELNVDPSASRPNRATYEARQRFSLPTDLPRGDIDPNILGVSFLAHINSLLPNDHLNDFTEASWWNWSLWDVSQNDNPPFPMKVGSEYRAINAGPSWIDIYFRPDTPIPTNRNDKKIYELRVKSANANASTQVYTHTPAIVPGVPLSGNLNYTNGSNIITAQADLRLEIDIGDWIQKANGLDLPVKVTNLSYAYPFTTLTIQDNYAGTTESDIPSWKALPMFSYDTNTQSYQENWGKSLSIRIWGDVGPSGRDILGNFYRHGTRYDSADNVDDGTIKGWTSAPCPSPEGVEALYFDMRKIDGGEIKPSVVDAIKIAPKTPGVRMHVYYTTNNGRSLDWDGTLRTPKNNKEWDHLVWRPINTVYTLRSNHTFELPHPIAATFIKLEFSRLQPLPFRLPAIQLPPVTYRRYPTWIETQFDNVTVKRVVEDWFIRNRTPVMVDILKNMSDPVLEFQYKEREFLAALALNKKMTKLAVNSGLVDIRHNTLIDPVTAAKIFVQTDNMYQSTLTTTIRRDNLLGQVVQDRMDPRIAGDPIEGEVTSSNGVPNVSTPNNRVSESYSHLAQTPMWFNRVTRHVYKIEKAHFNRKAYFVGINEVNFLRRNYTVLSDDNLITENLHDDDQIAQNTFTKANSSAIADLLDSPDASNEGVTVYASYSVEDRNYIDEPLTFLSSADAVTLQGSGAPAINFVVSSRPGASGYVYNYGQDYDIAYNSNLDDNVLENVMTIATSTDQAKYSVATSQKRNYRDLGIVYAKAFITSTETYTPHP